MKHLKTILFLLLALTVSKAQCQIINAFAGTANVDGYSGDGGPATAAKLSLPFACPDHEGNVYIVNTGSNCIRKVNSSGVITTIAGSATAGYSGDGGPASSALLKSPGGLAIDRFGVIYFIDSLIHIRRIGTDGIINTIAGNGVLTYSGDGGPATAAGIVAYSLAVDSSDNIYFSDKSNRIRKIDETGIVNTIAGIGVLGSGGDGGPATMAELSAPFGIAADNHGNVYFNESLVNKVRKISATGMISTIAGTGTGGPSTDGMPATAASLSSLLALGVDNDGNIYISDASSRIRKINTAGVITSIVGNGSSGDSGDGGPAIDAALDGIGGIKFDDEGNMYLSDIRLQVVRKVSGLSTTAVSPLSSTTNKLSVWPEPSDGHFNVRLSAAVAEPVRFVVTNVMGQQVADVTAVTNKDIVLQINAPAGLYMITALCGNERQTAKLTVR